MSTVVQALCQVQEYKHKYDIILALEEFMVQWGRQTQ